MVLDLTLKHAFNIITQNLKTHNYKYNCCNLAKLLSSLRKSYIIVATWAVVVCLICTPSALRPIRQITHAMLELLHDYIATIYICSQT